MKKGRFRGPFCWRIAYAQMDPMSRLSWTNFHIERGILGFQMPDFTTSLHRLLSRGTWRVILINDVIRKVIPNRCMVGRSYMAFISELQGDLIALAERSLAIRAMCQNEESTKQYLILPLLNVLGYNCANPYEVQPEYPAGFRDGIQARVDYAILRDNEPVIAVECKKFGSDLASNRGQLSAYFAALTSVRLGILTDGIQYEFFTDSENQNIMDEEPFITLDFDAYAMAPSDVLDALSLVCRSNFDPLTIVEAAETRLMSRRVRSILMQEVREPSEKFCRVILDQAGLKNLRRTSIQAYYSGLVRNAIEEALVLPVLDEIRKTSATSEREQISDSGGNIAQRIITTDRELAVYRYVCRRLAFLSPDEAHFSAIEQVQHQDYVGKFVVYYRNVRKGRLFEFIEGNNGYDKFVFPNQIGELVTNTMKDIDEPLRRIFMLRVREFQNNTGMDARSSAVA